MANSKQKQAIKRRLLAEFGSVCGICGDLHPPDELSVGKIRSKADGGTGRYENAILLCAGCVAEKQGKPMHEIERLP